MPRYQAVIEFWAENENQAGHAIGSAKDAIRAMTITAAGHAEKDGVAAGSIEVVSVRDVRPVASSAWPGVPHSPISPMEQPIQSSGSS